MTQIELQKRQSGKKAPDQKHQKLMLHRIRTTHVWTLHTCVIEVLHWKLYDSVSC